MTAGSRCWWSLLPASAPFLGPRPSALNRQIVSRLGGGVVDADLKHRKTALQFDRALFCAFLGAELGFQSSIDFEGKTGFWQFDRSAGHSESIVIRGVCIWLR
jgi:hypothetical protein